MLGDPKMVVGRALYAFARCLPARVITRIQGLAGRDLRARALLRRLTRTARHGAHPIARGPAKGLLIDVAGSRPSYVLGRAEADMQRLFAATIRPGDVVMDLGANIGFFTLVAAVLAGPTGRVIAYEPSPSTAQAVRRNVELNGLGHVTIVQAAVSDRDGVACLDLGASDQDASIVRRDGGRSIPVSTVSVDGEVARLGIMPAFIKVDVEGAEADVVAGMQATLGHRKTVVVCEVHDPADGLDGPVPRALRDAGYTVAWLDGIGDDWPPHLVARP